MLPRGRGLGLARRSEDAFQTRNLRLADRVSATTSENSAMSERRDEIGDAWAALDERERLHGVLTNRLERRAAELEARADDLERERRRVARGAESVDPRLAEIE